MNADDFRDYMLSFLFLRYLSDNYETAAQKELGPDYPKHGMGSGLDFCPRHGERPDPKTCDPETCLLVYVAGCQALSLFPDTCNHPCISIP